VDHQVFLQPQEAFQWKFPKNSRTPAPPRPPPTGLSTTLHLRLTLNFDFFLSLSQSNQISRFIVFPTYVVIFDFYQYMITIKWENVR
jgi:hypothetical protein